MPYKQYCISKYYIYCTSSIYSSLYSLFSTIYSLLSSWPFTKQLHFSAFQAQSSPNQPYPYPYPLPLPLPPPHQRNFIPPPCPTPPHPTLGLRTVLYLRKRYTVFLKGFFYTLSGKTKFNKNYLSMSVLAQFSQANQTTNPSKSISDTFLYIKTMMTDTNGNSAKEIERYRKL